jgi:hypothetical protein
MPRFLDPKGFGFKARGLQDTCYRLLIFRMYSKDKKRRFKTNLTLSLILRFNLRLEGLLHMECDFLSHPIQKKT